MGVSSVNPATRRQRCSRISFSAMLFSSVWLLLALYLSPVNGWAPVAESDHVQTKMLSYRPQEQKDNQKIEVIGEIKAQSTDDQDKFDITIFWHSKPQNNNNNNEKWIPIATRVSHQRSFHFQFHEKALKDNSIDTREKNAEICTYISGFKRANTGMYCQRNPMTGTGNEPSVVEKKLLLGGGDAETQQRQRSGSQKSSNGGSSIGGGANYASDLGVSLGITGKITPMGHFKVSVGMDEWHPESAFVMKQTYDQNRFSGFHFSLPAKEINRLAYGVAQPKVTLFIEDLQGQQQQQQGGKRGKGGKNGKTCVYTLSENPFETRKLAQELNIDINKDCKRTI